MDRQLTQKLTRKAQELGFNRLAVAPAEEAPHAAAFRRWLAAGRHGGMGWMKRHEDLRSSPTKLLPGARSLVLVTWSYVTQEPPPETWNDPARGRVARYAWGPDYHDVMRPRLHELADTIRSAADARTKVHVDTAPILERDFAAVAGLGFVGRNTQLISPGCGSYQFLGGIVTTAVLPTGSSSREASMEGCKTCRACLEVCPGGALVDEYELDARRCLSYLTIEQRGPIPEELRARLGRWVCGCDECQQVCPWNRGAQPGRRPFLSFDAQRFAPRLDELLALTPERFRDWYAGTPVERVTHEGLLRNACVAAGHSGERALKPALHRRTAAGSAMVREHAQWALERLGGP